MPTKKPKPNGRHLDYPIDLVPLTSVDPNPWNPNQQSDRTFQATQESLLAYGFVMPIVVRPHPDEPGRFQVIDGEHRWRALRAFADEGLPPGACESLVALHDAGSIPAQVVPMTDAQAKKFTVIANETRGRADEVELGALLSELAAEGAGLDDLMKGLPFSPAEVEELIALGDYTPDGKEPTVADAAPKEPSDPGEFERFKVAMPEAAYEVYEQASEMLSRRAQLHPDVAIAHGQVIEVLAAEYLATHGGLSD